MYQGDCREILCELPDESVHCCVTSPPYWGLRDYGVENQIGLEKTPEEYVAQLVAVFREVKRVLRKDATLWLNLGDSYAGSGCGWANNPDSKQNTNRHWADREGTIEFSKSKRIERGAGRWGGGNNSAPNLKPKDLCGIPWAVAFALRADGWYLRQDIVWSKPNPMPESVTDRCTKAHEYIFLLSKSATYFYDQEAIKEAAAWERWGDQTVIKEQQGTASWIGNKSKAELTGRGGKNAFRGQGANRDNENGHANRDGRDMQDIGTDLTRNKRSVWEVATSPFPEAHFATFPPELIKPCILAGCPSNGIVLDPFFGAGTTGLVSGALNCHCIGIELNQEYLEIAAKRLSQSVFQFIPESETSPELQQSLLGPDEEKKRNL